MYVWCFSKVQATHYLTHARYPGHSVSPVHSGLQLGGWPRWPGRQLHLSVPLLLHWEKGPQGLGVQGSRHTARWLVTSHEESTPQEITEQGSQHLLLNTYHILYRIFSGLYTCPADMLIPFEGINGQDFCLDLTGMAALKAGTWSCMQPTRRTIVR